MHVGLVIYYILTTRCTIDNIVMCVVFQKIVKVSVTRTYMYMCFNFLPEEARDLDSVYFLRTTEGMVPLPNTISEAEMTLPGLFEMGLLNGHSLLMLQQVINKVNRDICNCTLIILVSA